MDPVLIVGGGISGLSTAYYLSQAGISSILFEKTTRLGGLIQTDVIQGCRLEAGPDSYLAAKPAIKELARDLPALESQIISSNDTSRRVFVACDGRLLPLPSGMVMMAPGKWPPILRSDLLSAHAKAHLLREIFRKPRKRTEDISVGELVEDHFGSEVLELIAQGLSNKAIAARLYVTERTIEAHSKQIFLKLGLQTSPDSHRRVLAVLTYLRA